MIDVPSAAPDEIEARLAKYNAMGGGTPSNEYFQFSVWAAQHLPELLALARDGLHYRELTQHLTDNMIASGYTYTGPNAHAAAEDGE